MLVSTTVVSTRSFRPETTRVSWLASTTFSWICRITAEPSAVPQRTIVLASGTVSPPIRVNCR